MHEYPASSVLKIPMGIKMNFKNLTNVGTDRRKGARSKIRYLYRISYKNGKTFSDVFPFLYEIRKQLLTYVTNVI